MNGNWNSLTNTYGSYNAYIHSLTIDLSGNIYAGGYCHNGSYTIAGYWKNGEWNALTNIYGSYSSFAGSVVILED